MYFPQLSDEALLNRKRSLTPILRGRAMIG